MRPATGLSLQWDRPSRAAWMVAVALFGVLALGIVIGRADGPGTEGGRDGRRPGPLPVAPGPTRAEAAEAAARFLSGLSLEVILDDRRRSAALASMVDPGARVGLRRLYAEERDVLAPAYAGTTHVARAALLGYRIEDFADGRASVSVWSVALGASRRRPPATGWTTTTVRLIWRSRRWLVMGVSQVPGPSPGTSLDVLRPAAASFREYRHVP